MKKKKKKKKKKKTARGAATALGGGEGGRGRGGKGMSKNVRRGTVKRKGGHHGEFFGGDGVLSGCMFTYLLPNSRPSHTQVSSPPTRTKKNGGWDNWEYLWTTEREKGWFMGRDSEMPSRDERAQSTAKDTEKFRRR